MRNDEYKIRNSVMYHQDIAASEATTLLNIIDALRTELATAKETGTEEVVTLLLQGVAALRAELTKCRASFDRAVAKQKCRRERYRARLQENEAEIAILSTRLRSAELRATVARNIIGFKEASNERMKKELADAKEERTRIVEWMREVAGVKQHNADSVGYHAAANAWSEAAAAIEACEHLEGDRQTDGT